MVRMVLLFKKIVTEIISLRLSYLKLIMKKKFNRIYGLKSRFFMQTKRGNNNKIMSLYNYNVATPIFRPRFSGKCTSTVW